MPQWSVGLALRGPPSPLLPGLHTVHMDVVTTRRMTQQLALACNLGPLNMMGLEGPALTCCVVGCRAQILGQCPTLNPKQVQEALAFLSDQGAIYTTCDEYHFKAC